MKRLLFPAILLLALIAIGYLVFAQPTRAQGVPATVSFSTIADMQTLKNKNAKDSFAVTVTDAQVSTSLDLTCTAGSSRFLGLQRSDKACSVSGTGAIINPSTKQSLPRAQYSGGYIVKSDGFTDATTIIVNYLAVGKVAPSQSVFGGSMNLKPELTSTGASALKDRVLGGLTQNAGAALIDQRVDTVDLERLVIPSAGLPSDMGCTWSGNMVFAYQTDSWFLDLTAKCGDAVYELAGNMPWTDSPGVDSQTQYDLTLTLPTADAVGDDALFASATADGDLFATAQGITAQIIMKESARVTVTIDGTPTETPSRVDASGSFNGNGVPVEVVRSLATLFGLLSSNLFGA